MSARRVSLALAGATAVVMTLAACTSASINSAAMPSVSSSTSSTAPLSSSTPAPRTTPVPAPGNGDISETIASGDPGEITKVSLDEKAELPGDIAVTLRSVEAEEVTGETPGELSGPALAVTVRVTNDSNEELDLGSTVVTLTDANGVPGQATTAGGANPFTGVVAAGSHLDAVYVFGISGADTSSVQVTVSYAGGAPVALFSGDTP